jgi:hypothetical protein
MKDELVEILEKRSNPIFRHPVYGILIASYADWAGEETVETDDGRIESIPKDFCYIGLWNPISWARESGPDCWIDDTNLPEEVRREMLNTEHFSCVNLSDLQWTGK